MHRPELRGCGTSRDAAPAKARSAFSDVTLPSFWPGQQIEATSELTQNDELGRRRVSVNGSLSHTSVLALVSVAHVGDVQNAVLYEVSADKRNRSVQLL